MSTQIIKNSLETQETKKSSKYMKKYKIFEREYLGPDLDLNAISKLELKKDKTKHPIYVDSKGNYYDLNYCLLDSESLQTGTGEWEFSTKKTEESSNNQNNIEVDPELTEKELLNKFAPKKSEEISPFPQPDQYETFNEFEQAILDWKKETEKGIGYLQIPKPMGRTYSRPYFGGTSNTSDPKSDSRTSVSSIGSISEGNRGSMDSRGSIGNRMSTTDKNFSDNSTSNSRFSEQIDPFKQMPKTMPGTNLLMIEKNEWQDQLIPTEPDPLFYDTLEEYENAYLKWGEAVLKTTEILPPHPSQFVEMFGLKTALEIEKKEQERSRKEKARLFQESIEKKKKKTTITGTNNHFIWRQRLERELQSSMSISGIEALNDLMLTIYGKRYKTILKEIKEIEEQKRKRKELQNKQMDEEQDGSNTNLMLQLSFNQDQTTKLENLLGKSFSRTESILNIEVPVQHKIYDEIERLWEIINKNESYFKSQLRPLIGRFHGRLPKDTEIRSGTKKKKTDGNTRVGIINTSLSTLNLRRKDLTGPMIAKSMNCPNIINKKIVNFRLLDYQLNDPIKIKELKNPNIKDKLKFDIKMIDLNNRLENLEARCNPKIYLTNTIKEQKKKISQIITEAKKLSLIHIKKILCNNMLLDVFNNTLNEYFFYKNREVSYMQLFLQLINPYNFFQILDLYMESSSLLTHAKLASFVCEALQSASFKEILEMYIKKKKLKCLYLIAYSLNFFKKIPISIYPYQPEISEIAKQILNNNISKIEKNIFVHYYITIILQSIQNSESSMAYVSVTTHIKEMLDKIKVSFAKLCRKNKKFLSESIFKGISCRSSKLSAYFTFMLIYLLKINDQKLLDLLKSSKTGLIEKIRQLSKTKFQHVRFACSQFFEIMKENDIWREHIFKTLTVNDNIFLKDFTPPPKPVRLDEEEKVQPPFISELIHNFLIECYDKFDKKKEFYVLTPNLFFILLSHLEKMIAEKYSNNVLQLISSLMLKIITTFYNLGKIENGKANTASKKMKASKTSKIIIDYRIIMKLMKAIKNLSSNHDIVQSNLLIIISKLVRRDEIFSLIKKDETFFYDLHAITRDAKSPCLAKHAWKLFEECVYYHGGLIDLWKNNKILISFFELLNSRTIYVLIYALQSFYKIFDMADHEIRRFEKGKYATRTSEKDSLKSMEKDLKLLASIFDEKFVFVKLNMIYQGSGKSESGMVFVNLAKMYNEIINNPIFNKVHKKAIKKEEYKDGLIFFDNYINGFSENSKKKKKKDLKPSFLSKGKIFTTQKKGKVIKKPPKKEKKKSSKKKSKK
ncbi:sca1 complex scaffold protein scaa [Anaeramoeba flamelloides]|uniref:Sca1 complex scaffold protein scaa n=1 Tax=Anaeramoeba flamelloides TaxID=1746091 RepID=A0AAV7Z500_9EUKA|nr:sca1 complex scaffold protein scaa [Anaeramoeba flamelloides]